MGLEKKKVIKYHVCSGFFTREIDGNNRFISATQVARLYDLKRAEWTICGEHPTSCRTKNVEHLYPRYSGDYELGTKKKSN